MAKLTKKELASEIAFCGRREEFYQKHGNSHMYIRFKTQRLEYQMEYDRRFQKKVSKENVKNA